MHSNRYTAISTDVLQESAGVYSNGIKMENVLANTEMLGKFALKSTSKNQLEHMWPVEGLRECDK